MHKKLELTWCGKEENISIEPRLLIEKIELSNIEYDIDTTNMLIHGDNLLALKALESNYSGKVKCIYIDPPYNINAMNENYDDLIEHSMWLSKMKTRIELLRMLLQKKNEAYNIAMWYQNLRNQKDINNGNICSFQREKLCQILPLHSLLTDLMRYKLKKI